MPVKTSSSSAERCSSTKCPATNLRPIGRVRHLSRTNFGKALDRLPLENTGSVRDLQGPSYVFAILMDDRIRRGEW